MPNIAYIFPNDTQRSAYSIGAFDYYPIRDYLHNGHTDGILANGLTLSFTNSAAVNFNQTEYVSLESGKSFFKYTAAHNESFITPVNLYGNIKISGTVASPVDLTVKIFINGIAFNLGTKTFTGSSERFFRDSTTLTAEQRFTFLKSVHNTNAHSSIGFEITTSRTLGVGDSIYVNDLGFIKTAGIDYTPTNTLVNGDVNQFPLDYLAVPLSTYGYGFHFYNEFADIYYNNGLVTNNAQVAGADNALFALLVPASFNITIYNKITLRLSLKNDLAANENRDSIIEAHIGNKFWGFSDSVNSAIYTNYDIPLTHLDYETFSSNQDGTGGFLPLDLFDTVELVNRVIYLSGFNEGMTINSASLILDSPINDEFDMFTSGIASEVLDCDMYLRGASGDFNTFHMHVHDDGIRVANLNLFTHGIDWTELDLSTDLHMTGGNFPMTANQIAMRLSSDLDPAGLLNMFLMADQQLQQDISFYIGGKHPDIDSLFQMFMMNDRVDAHRPVDMFMKGAYIYGPGLPFGIFDNTFLEGMDEAFQSQILKSTVDLFIARDSESLQEFFDLFLRAQGAKGEFDMTIGGANIFDMEDIEGTFYNTFKEGMDEAFPNRLLLYLYLRSEKGEPMDKFNM